MNKNFSMFSILKKAQGDWLNSIPFSILNDDDYNYRPGFFDTPALLYTPIQPALAQKCRAYQKWTIGKCNWPALDKVPRDEFVVLSYREHHFTRWMNSQVCHCTLVFCQGLLHVPAACGFDNANHVVLWACHQVAFVIEFHGPKSSITISITIKIVGTGFFQWAPILCTILNAHFTWDFFLWI